MKARKAKEDEERREEREEEDEGNRRVEEDQRPHQNDQQEEGEDKDPEEQEVDQQVPNQQVLQNLQGQDNNNNNNNNQPEQKKEDQAQGQVAGELNQRREAGGGDPNSEDNNSDGEDSSESSNSFEDNNLDQQMLRKAIGSLAMSQRGINKNLKALKKAPKSTREDKVDCKINVAPYSSYPSENLELFLWQLETMFLAKNVSNQLKVVYSISNLKGKALLHIQSLGERARTFTWSDFKDHMKDTFSPKLEQEKQLKKLTNLKQTRDLVSYVTEFRTTMNKLDIPMNLQLLYFARGLRLSVQAELRLKKPENINHAIEIATIYETAKWEGLEAKI